MILHFVLVALLRTSMHLKIRVVAKMNNILFSNFFRENRRESHAPFVKTYATLGYLWNWTLYYKVTSDNEWCFDKKLGNEFYLIRLWFWLKKGLDDWLFQNDLKLFNKKKPLSDSVLFKLQITTFLCIINFNSTTRKHWKQISEKMTSQLIKNQIMHYYYYCSNNNKEKMLLQIADLKLTLFFLCA